MGWREGSFAKKFHQTRHARKFLEPINPLSKREIYPLEKLFSLFVGDIGALFEKA
jgi:hypothetical protein